MAKTKSSTRASRMSAKQKQAATPTRSRIKTAPAKAAAREPAAAKKRIAATKAPAAKRTAPRSKAAAPRVSATASHVWPGLPPGYFDRTR